MQNHFPTTSFRLGVLLLVPLALSGCDSTTPEPTSTGNATKTGTQPTSPARSDLKVFKVGASGLQVAVPVSWKAEVEGSTLSLTSPDQGVFMAFVPAPNAAEARQFVEELKASHKKNQNYKDNGASVVSQVGSLKSSRQSGSFEAEGERGSFATDTVKAKSLVVIYSLVQDSFKDRNAADIETIRGSIKATK